MLRARLPPREETMSHGASPLSQDYVYKTFLVLAICTHHSYVLVLQLSEEGFFYIFLLRWSVQTSITMSSVMIYLLTLTHKLSAHCPPQCRDSSLLALSYKGNSQLFRFHRKCIRSCPTMLPCRLTLFVCIPLGWPHLPSALCWI